MKYFNNEQHEANRFDDALQSECHFLPVGLFVVRNDSPEAQSIICSHMF